MLFAAGFFASKTIGVDFAPPPQAMENYGMRDEQEKCFAMQKGPSCGMVFKILAQVALGTGFGKFIPDAGVFHIYQVVEFCGNLVVAFL